MTTDTVTAAIDTGPADPRRQADNLVGTGVLVRLAVRRERIPLAIWIYALCITIIASFPTLKSLYPDEASRAAIATGIGSTPAFLVMTGPVGSTSLGGLTAWRYGVLGATMISLMAIFTVVRRTRADEETGRTELLAAGVLGRYAPLAAALAVAWGACLVIGAVVAIGAIALGQPVAGSIAFGAALAGPGLVFAAVAAVGAQLVESARVATAIAGSVLAVAFALRAVGDTGSGIGFLSWLSPIGWTAKIQAYGGNHWWVLLLFAALTVAGTAAAATLQSRRDVGLGVWPARPGPSTNPRLRSPLSLAGRLQRGSLIGWTIGFVGVGAISGGIANNVGDLIGDNPQMIELMHQLGGPGAMTDVLLATMGTVGGLLAGAYGISAALRAASEESAERAAPVLATAVGRGRWLGGHLLFALAGPAWLLLVGGVVTGLLYGAATGDLAHGFGKGMASMAVQYPAAATMAGLAVLLFGVLPRLTVLAWAALGAALLLGQLGPLLKLPRAVMDLSPYSHVPLLPSVPMAWTPVLVLVLAAAALAAAGLVAFRRRDLRSAG
jgi:ABC-2 type transport system permease protein